MKFVRLLGGYASSASKAREIFKSEGGAHISFNCAAIESVAPRFDPPIINLITGDRAYYCDMTESEVVAAFAAAGVDL